MFSGLYRLFELTIEKLLNIGAFLMVREDILLLIAYFNCRSAALLIVIGSC